MRGEWARACDREACHWDETVRPLDHPGAAAFWIASALDTTIGMQARVGHAETAGAHVRAWRKSLPMQGTRRPDVVDPPVTGLLWGALHRLGDAKYWQAMGDVSGMAHELRCSEALLRTWWKQQVVS